MTKLYQYFPFSQLEVAPWKNGLGETREVLRHPLEGSFEWRVSFATISQDSDFSDFSGYDRLLVCASEDSQISLAEKGDQENIAVTTLNSYDSLLFRGEQKFRAVEVEKPTLDYNVMVRRDWGRMAIAEKVVSAVELDLFDEREGVCFFTVLRGNCNLSFFLPSDSHGVDTVSMNLFDTLQIRAGVNTERLRIVNVSSGFVGFLVKISKGIEIDDVTDNIEVSLS